MPHYLYDKLFCLLSMCDEYCMVQTFVWADIFLLNLILYTYCPYQNIREKLIFLQHLKKRSAVVIIKQYTIVQGIYLFGKK